MRAICSPKVGPIELDEKSSDRHAEVVVERLLDLVDLVGGSSGTAIWKTFSPSSGSLTAWILASP